MVLPAHTRTLELIFLLCFQPLYSLTRAPHHTPWSPINPLPFIICDFKGWGFIDENLRTINSSPCLISCIWSPNPILVKGISPRRLFPAWLSFISMIPYVDCRNECLCTLHKNAPLTLPSRMSLRPLYWNHHFLFFHSLPTIRMTHSHIATKFYVKLLSFSIFFRLHFFFFF